MFELLSTRARLLILLLGTGLTIDTALGAASTSTVQFRTIGPKLHQGWWHGISDIGANGIGQKGQHIVVQIENLQMLQAGQLGRDRSYQLVFVERQGRERSAVSQHSWNGPSQSIPSKVHGLQHGTQLSQFGRQGSTESIAR